MNPSLSLKIRRDGRRCRQGPHKGNYQTPEVENPYSRYDILESLVANSLWVNIICLVPPLLGLGGLIFSILV